MASGITKESWFHRLTEIISCSQAFECFKNHTILGVTKNYGPTWPNFHQLPLADLDSLGSVQAQNGQRSLLQPLCDLSDDEGEETKGSTALKGWNLRTSEDQTAGFPGVASPTLVVFQEAWGLA